MNAFVVTLMPFRQMVTVVGNYDVLSAADEAHALIPDADWAWVNRANEKPHYRDPWRFPDIKVVFR